MIGEKHGRLLVLSGPLKIPNGTKATQSGWICVCDCGVSLTVSSRCLKSGRVRSCGCLLSDTAKALRKVFAPNLKHGHFKNKQMTGTYSTWAAMRARCLYPKHKSFKDYGGRGVSVCERWDSFENFLSDMGERPDGKTIDRIDVHGNYELLNCKWATAKEQASNRRISSNTTNSQEN